MTSKQSLSDRPDKKRRKKGEKNKDAIKIPDSADLCYCFPDGGSFAGVIKLFSSWQEHGNFHFTRDAVSFVRSNSNLTILGDAKWKADAVMVKGDPEDIAEEGFNFGVDLKEFHTTATRTLTKNDRMLLYFRGDNSNMYVEQVNHKTSTASSNETPFTNKHVPTKSFSTRMIGKRNLPNVVVRAEEFFIQINLLAVAKCLKVNVQCNKEGIRFSGENKDGKTNKSVAFGPARTDFDDDLKITIPNKKLKTIILMRNISKPSSLIRVFYENGMPLLIMCDMGPEDNCYGHFKLYLKEERKPDDKE